MVPRPDRDPHPGLRGRQPGPVLPGQRQRLRGVPAQGARRRGRPAAPDPLQEARRLTVTTIVPRWEWRTFGDRFSAADAVFDQLEASQVLETDELYLLAPGANN